jgi:citronellol/citronellal dehydrogenase
MALRVNRIASHLTAGACAGKGVDQDFDYSKRQASSADDKGRIGTGSIWHPDCQVLDCAGSLKGKTLFITGGSRGIGFAMARRAAKDGANVAIAAKTEAEHPTLPGTIYSAAEEVRRLGGQALPVIVDVRDEESIARGVAETVKAFGGIDILVNCASAIFPAPTERIDLKRLDLMWQITTRAPLLTAKHCVPHLKRSAKEGRNPHILTCSPPVNFYGDWPQPSNPNYMVCKMGMTTGAMAMANELRAFGVAANTLWPATAIATSAVNHLAGNDPKVIDDMYMASGRTPEIQADAAYAMFTSKSSGFSANQCIDEDVVVRAGCKDLSIYDYSRSGATREDRLRHILRL